MDAIEFLLTEHARVRKILADISDGSHRDSTKKQLFEDLCSDLIRHEKMEQTVWYPHFRYSDKLDDTVKHLLKEEQDAEKTIKTFDPNLSEEQWDKKFQKFKMDVEHHAEEEEQKLFPQVRKILDETQLKHIGQEMREFKAANS